MNEFDVVIIGASFSGLTLAHHLPKHLKVLIVDAKPAAGSTVESTGLITTKTYEEFASFIDIKKYITNPITAICVIAPSFDEYFVSTTKEPWINQTDTKALVKAMADTLPSNVTLRMKTVFQAVDNPEKPTKVRIQTLGGQPEEVAIKFLVGADGGRSPVAAKVKGLDANKRFLFGYEQVFFGDVHLGPNPDETIYHFWFGEFSLGYGGWLSPTIVDGRKAFRIGLAKLMKDRSEATGLMKKFIQILLDRKTISIEGEINKPGYVFGSMIPIGGTRKRIASNNVLLIGDAAGFCGAFAADGIKGSVISGKEAALIIDAYLKGDKAAPMTLRKRMEAHGGMMGYYWRQLHYRWIWDMMKSDRTFRAMYNIIEAERETFLDQFCDAKDTRRSLSWTVLKVRYIPKLFVYAWYIFLDLFKR